jgi:hypothetical protein
MKTSIKPLSPLVIFVLVIWSLSLACGFSSKIPPSQPANQDTPQTQASPTPQAEVSQPTLEPGPETSPDDALLLQPDPLDRLLDLRSIQFTLTYQYPDETLRAIEAEIDSSGSMHLKITDPEFDSSGMPEDFEKVTAAPVTELYVLAGKAYMVDDMNPDWKTTPVDKDFTASFSRELHGMDGLALWLNLLPPGSITPNGSEKVGGITADRSIVAGEISGSKIYGTIWKDPRIIALVQAELHVPAALLSSPDDPQTGELVISLKVHTASVEPISLPQ